jgi:thioesterase domain-containing protein
VQPQGPYFLAGYSLGGAAAWETARQLEAAGERVALLALIDAPFPRRPLGVRAREFAGALRRRLRRPLGEGVVFAPPPTETGLETALRAVRVANRHAFHAYRPRRRSGRLVVLSLARPATHRVYAGVEAWTRLATGVVERHAVPGTHLSLLDEPHVEHVARILGECLERAAPAMRGLPATLPGHGAP